MGNSISAKKKTAKVMKLDGTVIRVKAPATAGDVLRHHPGHSLLEADDVQRLGVRARPLPLAKLLGPGKIYFLVEQLLPRAPDQRGLRRARSGAMQASAMDRLESLRLSRRRRSTPNASLAVHESATAAAGGELGGAVQVRIRLPKAHFAKLLEESKDSSEAAEMIVALCLAEKAKPATAGSPAPARKERRTRFMPVVDETRQQGLENS